ncbi:MAG: hypothetical protein ACXWL2_02570 [Candidatus Chromulinivorax sp.]
MKNKILSAIFVVTALQSSIVNSVAPLVVSAVSTLTTIGVETYNYNQVAVFQERLQTQTDLGDEFAKLKLERFKAAKAENLSPVLAMGTAASSIICMPDTAEGLQEIMATSHKYLKTIQRANLLLAGSGIALSLQDSYRLYKIKQQINALTPEMLQEEIDTVNKDSANRQARVDAIRAQMPKKDVQQVATEQSAS